MSFEFIRLHDRINNLQQQITTQTELIKQMIVDLTNLTAAVTNEASVEASAVILIQGIAAEIAAAVAGANTDPTTQASIDSLTAQLNAAANTLASAVTSAPGQANVVIANTTPASN